MGGPVHRGRAGEDDRGEPERTVVLPEVRDDLRPALHERQLIEHEQPRRGLRGPQPEHCLDRFLELDGRDDRLKRQETRAPAKAGGDSLGDQAFGERRLPALAWSAEREDSPRREIGASNGRGSHVNAAAAAATRCGSVPGVHAGSVHHALSRLIWSSVSMRALYNRGGLSSSPPDNSPALWTTTSAEAGARERRRGWSKGSCGESSEAVVVPHPPRGPRATPRAKGAPTVSAGAPSG